MSRSHKVDVPTARPPAAARKILYMWGRGKIGSEVRAYLKHANAVIEDDDAIARKLAIAHGCPISVVSDVWALRIEGAAAGELDALTREDSAVMGWTENRRETCAPSVALRNALNAITKTEYDEVGNELGRRFAILEHRHGEDALDRWIARDNRVVFFDAERSEWRLGDYAGTPRG
ncbi:MAG: hypothetical protein ACXVAC_15920 [Vulcanimicrobiaceae bacterium]